MDTLSLTHVDDPEEELANVKRKLEDDTSLDSPNKRQLTVLQSDFQVKQLRDILEQIRITLGNDDTVDPARPEFEASDSALRNDISVF